MFTTYDRSNVASLDYAVNRSYSSGQGRFTTVDPIGMASGSILDPQSNNLYAYTQNNPVDFTDPTGLFMMIDWASCIVTGVLVRAIPGYKDGAPIYEIVGLIETCNTYSSDPVSPPTREPNDGPGIQIPPLPRQDDDPPPPPRKKKCEQGLFGKDIPEIKMYLDYLGLSQFIDMNSIVMDPKHTEGINFRFTNATGAKEYIEANSTGDKSKFFNAGLGKMHNKAVSGGKVSIDARSRQGESGSGFPGKSLQFDIGSPDKNNKDAPITGYADLDCDNPKQRPVKHIWKVIGFGEH